MLNGNTIQPVFTNENQTNTQSNQLHFLGTIGVGNYFANDNLGPLIRPNKRVREVENINNNIQRQQKLQMSLNYNVGEEMLKENLVSTGLKLSYEEEHNSSVTSDSLLHRQKHELDQLIKIQATQMAKGVRDMKQRHITSFLTTLEKEVSKKLQEKDMEIDNLNKKNNELMDRIKQMTMEVQNWHYRAKYNESVINVLKTNLEQVMSQNMIADKGKEGFGDSEINDAASSYIDPNLEIQKMKCRVCNAKEISVLVVPCRHLSLCKECDVFTEICPFCKSLKTSSVQVLFS